MYSLKEILLHFRVGTNLWGGKVGIRACLILNAAQWAIAYTK